MQRQNENAVLLSYITQIDRLHKWYRNACLVEAKPHSSRVLFLVSVILVVINNYFFEKESDRAHQRAAMGCYSLKDRETRIKSNDSDNRAGVSTRAQSHSPYARWAGQNQGQWVASAKGPDPPKACSCYCGRSQVNPEILSAGQGLGRWWLELNWRPIWTEHPELSLKRAPGPWDRVLGGGPRQHWVKAVEAYLYPQNLVRADGSWTKSTQAESRQSQVVCTKAESSTVKRTSHRGQRSQKKQQQEFSVETDQKTARERNITLNSNKCFYQQIEYPW